MPPHLPLKWLQAWWMNDVNDIPFSWWLQAMLGATLHATGNSWKAILAQNTLANTIRNMNQKLLITLTPRQFLVDGYNIPIIASMKALGGMAGEDEDPNGRYAFMAAVSSWGQTSVSSCRQARCRLLICVISCSRGTDQTEDYGRRILESIPCLKQVSLRTGTDWRKDTELRAYIIHLFVTWNLSLFNSSEFSCWSGKSCNQIKGSEGAFFPPPISSSTVLTVFSPELNG